MHCHWRDCKEWERIGLPMSTTSNEACKLYDAVLTQAVGWYNDPSVGGLSTCMKKLVECDPNFVMGRVVSLGIGSSAGQATIDKELAGRIEEMVNLAEKTTITDREQLHVKAVKEFTEGDPNNANAIWNEILVKHPTDLLATRLAHICNLTNGYQSEVRDLLARVLPYWTKDMPHYGYLLGMYSFGLEENRNYEKAEKTARKSLEINSRDIWASHALSHVMEMEGRCDEGITYMTNTVKEWSTCDIFACHHFWHWALYYIEKGDYEAALGVYDSEVGRRVKEGHGMLSDATSFLYRLEMEGHKVGDRWGELFPSVEPILGQHNNPFRDAHVLMGCLGAGHTDKAHKMIDSIREHVKGTGYVMNKLAPRDLGVKLCEGMLAFDEGDFAKAVDLLHPIRNTLPLIGYSNAQRDVFNLLLINATLKCSTDYHKQLSRQLLYERKALKGNSPMTDRQLAQLE